LTRSAGDVKRSAMTFQLYYWPSIQGRGEFVRLTLEEAGADYVDVARQPVESGGGVPALLAVLRDASERHPPFAPPVLRDGSLLIAQTANILMHLGRKLDLVPEDDASRLFANQVQLTIADVATEVHDVHHPIASSLYYEDQKVEAARRAKTFTSERLEKLLGYFERVLGARGGDSWVFGDRVSYVDLSLFQLLSGLEYAFPRSMARLAPKLPRLASLEQRVADRPRVAAYLASPRRLPFSVDGLFRHYPELDFG
jgi:glutathione S-transferase